MKKTTKTKPRAANKAVSPSELSLTEAETKVLKVITALEEKGETITAASIRKKWPKTRSYVYKVVTALIEKKLVERYTVRYYRLTPTI